MSDVTYAVYNELVDQVNAGRSLVKYGRHFTYCPHAPSLRVMSPETAVEQAPTCNCGLAEAICLAFGREVPR